MHNMNWTHCFYRENSQEFDWQEFSQQQFHRQLESVELRFSNDLHDLIKSDIGFVTEIFQETQLHTNRFFANYAIVRTCDHLPCKLWIAGLHRN